MPPEPVGQVSGWLQAGRLQCPPFQAPWHVILVLARCGWQSETHPLRSLKQQLHGLELLSHASVVQRHVAEPAAQLGKSGPT